MWAVTQLGPSLLKAGMSEADAGRLLHHALEGAVTSAEPAS